MNTTTYGTGTGPRAQQAQRDAAERKQLAEDLARWAGEDAAREHDETVRTDTSYGVPFQHGQYCCAAVRDDAERNMYAFAIELPLDKLRARHASELADRQVAERVAALPDIEPPPGWEQRAEDRARREGLIA